MQDFLKDLLFTVVTAAVPVLTVYLVALIRKAGDSAAANAENVKAKTYITEVTEAIAVAVAATNQTFVDAAKRAGKFDTKAQLEAAQMALAECISSISPAAREFIADAYGGVEEYLVTRIEAEVRRQKRDDPATLSVPMEAVEGVREVPDTATIAATTAAATAATVVKDTIAQLAAAMDEMPTGDLGEEGDTQAQEDAPPPPEKQEFFFGLG